MLYNFFLNQNKYELRKSNFKVFNNIVGKHKCYSTTKVLNVSLNIPKNNFKWDCKGFSKKKKKKNVKYLHIAWDII